VLAWLRGGGRGGVGALRRKTRCEKGGVVRVALGALARLARLARLVSAASAASGREVGSGGERGELAAPRVREGARVWCGAGWEEGGKEGR
jgi:hypothetical protein